MDLLRAAYRLATDSRSRFPRWLLLPFVLAEAVLCGLIILRVPYTEIDWKAYMEQIAQYQAGERDYALIKGGTGPLVYPAGHVYAYSLLHHLTGAGVDVRMAQWVFMGLYLATLGVVGLCYREARAPPYLLPLLLLSKRLHSIYLLRLFNDPLSTLLLFTALYLWQKKLWTLGSAAYSLSVSVKMHTLLPLPAVGLIYLQALGRDAALRQALIMAQIQFLLATPFLAVAPWSYVSRAFEVTRRFEWRWTVNWRFVGEEVFTSGRFAVGLLVVHASLLVIFGITRWKSPSHRPLSTFITLLTTPATGLEAHQISARITPRFTLTAVLAANTVGMLCARSLHYQFYCWLAWGAPYVLWASGLGPVWVCVLWAAQEWAWNVYPSTPASSGVVVACLAVAVAGVWWGGRNEEGGRERERKER